MAQTCSGRLPRTTLVLFVLLAANACDRGGVAAAAGTSDTPVAAQRQTPAGGTRRALLIGVGDYLNNDVPKADRAPGWEPKDLGGAVNDVVLIKQVLTTRFDFQPENIVTLTDSQATRAAMLDAMNRIVDEAGPEDVVYIHFSGHGSQAPDTNGDEMDGKDETLLPYDARTKGIRDITDDELNAIFQKLRAKETLITLDSCHSGTATRGASDVSIRGGDADSRAELYSAADERGGGSSNGPVDGSSTMLPETARYVLMTGAAAEQSALDSTIGGNTRYGWFSWSLANTLSSVDQDTSAGEVFFRVQQKMYNVGEMKRHRAPLPQMEAPEGARAKPLLGGGILSRGAGGAATRTWVTADPGGNDTILLRQGPLFGAVEGSTWAIFPPGTEDFDGTPQLGRAVVKSRGGGNSTAELQVTADIPPGSRAVLIAPSWRRDSTRVWLDHMTAGEKKAFTEAMQATKVGASIEFVDGDTPARFVIDLQDGTCRVFTSGKLQLIESFAFVDMTATVAKAAEIFDRSMKIADLQALDNPASKIRLDLTLNPVDSEGKPSLKAVEGAEPLPAYRIRREGEGRTAQNNLVLEVSADRDVYLTVVQIDAAGTVTVLFPNAGSEEWEFYPGGLIPANKTIRLPDSLSEEDLTAGFFLDIRKPTGLFTLRAFAATDAETATRLRAYIGESGVAEQALAEEKLYRDLYAATPDEAGTRGEDELVARGAQVTTIAKRRPIRDWTATSVTFVAEE